MAENVLNGLLSDEISLQVLFKWLLSENHRDEQSVSIESNFTCTPGDFISHFLNYIHEDAPNFDTDIINKNTFTPKSIKSSRNRGDHKPHVKKRPALFNDIRISHSHTFPVIPAKCSSEVNKLNVSSDFKSNGTSTPKLMKTNSDNVLDASYGSPISPLYSRNNFNSPKNRSILKSAEKSLCLGDFIVTRKCSSKKKVQRSLCEDINAKTKENIENKKCRRIKPTNLNEKRFSGGFKETENSFNFNDNYIELTVNNLNEQRNLLVEERLKIKNNIDDIIKPTNVKLQTFNNKIEVNPVPDKVTFIAELEILIGIYIFLLNKGFVLNIASELYFLISLMLSKQILNNNLDDSDTDIQMIPDNIENRRDLFKTVHNCVYFAVNCLKSQIDLFKAFDRSTLKLMCENERVKLFSIEFSDNLNEIYTNKFDSAKENNETVQRNVCFISDTDNRDNFPNDTSFHAFRKQRDLFYEILRIWEQNHFLPEWNFAIALGGKIKSLLNLHCDPVNYRHFARLFKMQLLTTSRQNTDDDTINEQASILASLPNVNADKLHRLKTRLITKQENNELNSTPAFNGHQEFYKDFILTSGSHIFYEHLKDTIILEINQTISTNLNDFFDDFTVNLSMRNSYSQSLRILRILAKFLGFLDSLSYRIDSKLVCDNVLKAEIEVRKWFQPNFALKEIVLNSLKNKSLILNIPWIVTYLSMLDYITLRLPYFDDILEMLFCIYYTANAQFELNYNRIMIKFSLGWLFELPHFPSESYYNWISKFSFKGASHNLKLNLNDLKIDKNHRTPSLDNLEIIDQTLLYTFCPYLEGFRKLLSTNSSNSSNVVKHITPLSTVENSSDITEKKLKTQLEEAFFNCQPISIRKTVEFISERVASSCVKHICNNVVPEFKKTSLDGARSVLLQITRDFDRNEDYGKIENTIKTKINELIPQYLKQLQEICAEEIEKITKTRIIASIEALLAVDELPQTKETCVLITKRLCFERVQQWINSHINIGLFNKFKTLHFEILKNLNSHETGIQDKPVFQLPSGGRQIEHNPNTFNAVKIVENIKNMSINLLEDKEIESPYIKDFLQATERAFLERCDVNAQILNLTNRMLVDLMLLLITHRIDIFDDNLECFTKHWTNFSKPTDELFKNLISPRNIILIAQSKDVPRSWQNLSKFVVNLISTGLLSCDDFESQSIAIYKHEWDQTTLKHVSTCFQDVIDGINAKRPNEKNFTQLLNFISSYCVEMDF
ncbi:codanin-1 [Holotrichia oblita]|uniref:Codanin-1 n=1 Tax=Holotrichia oblita TaxID=644536 RepID=A0ACB9SLE5_HOLOL|nr:codanin-1 [Holotrichia oblita]